MAWNKELVYIPELNPDTWLLKSVRKDSACLRNYLKSPEEEIRGLSRQDVESMLAAPSARRMRLPSLSLVSTKSHQFWADEIRLLNIESRLSCDDEQKRLQARFQEECSHVLQDGDHKQLRAKFDRWVRWFRYAKDRKEFNHWDNDSASRLLEGSRGLVWQSRMLEHCRRNNQSSYINTGNPETDFCFVAMEYGFGISSKRSPFGSGSPAFLIPDGIALRRDGYFTVIEVKRENDDETLVTPMMQATCAALALYAKRKNIVKISRSAGAQRPAFKSAAVPASSRSIGVHVLTATNPDGTPRTSWSPDIEAKCKTVLNAFPQLKYIAYSFITPEQAETMTAFKTDRLVVAVSD